MNLVLVVGVVLALQITGAAEQRGANLQVDVSAVVQALWAPRSAEVVGPTVGDQVVNGRRISGDGIGTLTYSVMERCDATAARLVEHFRASGWRQRRSQILMPRLRTSFLSGCERVPHGIVSSARPPKGKEEQIALAWHGEWEDDEGNTVTYDVSSDGSRATVRATFLPVEVALARGLRPRRPSPR